jgi:hypothetical protein
MKLNLKSLLIMLSLFIGGCSFPDDRKDNPNNEPVVHTGNATDTLPVESQGSAVLTKADSARMVFNDDSSVSGTPSGRGTERKGEAVGTGTSRPGENYPNPNHPADSTIRK